ncbi:MAG: response regulator transcription factor [Bacteroidaceae bacterium]|nr:response regulator transcription factor [Bacteroidaceae bacterium]
MKKVLIIDDHPVFCMGLEAYLQREGDIEVLPSANDGDVALTVVKTEQPDIVIHDLVMPDMNTPEHVKWIKRLSPKTQILVVSGYFNEAMLMPLLDIGISGFVSKNASPQVIIEAVRCIMDGSCWFGTSMQSLIERVKTGKQLKTDVLTPREMEIITLSCQGLQYKEIAEMLGISFKTVDNIKSNIFHKLSVNSTTEVVIYAFRNGLVDLNC